MSIILLFLSLSILLIGVAIIIHIKDKRAVISTVLSTDEDEDIIDAVINKKRNKLSAKPWGMKFNTYIGIAVLGSAVLGGGAYLFTNSILLTCVAAIIGMFVPELVSLFRDSREQAKFEERYARALRQIASSIKAGLTIQQAISDVCESPFIHDNIRDEFRQLDADIRVGMSVQKSFMRFAERVGSSDAMDVAIALSMQNEVGGSTSEVVETITRDINTRMMTRKETKSLFSGAATTITMMDVTPLAIVGFISFAAPSYLEPFFATSLMKLVFWALIVFMCAGTIVIRRMVAKMKKKSEV
jgi:tight adherence protein B